jgi:hypothetical protein
MDKSIITSLLRAAMVKGLQEIEVIRMAKED